MIRRFIPTVAVVVSIAVVSQLSLLPEMASATANQSPAITSASTAHFNIGQAGSFMITTTASPTAVITETGSVPFGLSFMDNGDGTAIISGIPSAGGGGTFPLNLTANNGVAPNATQTLILTVGQPPAITSGTTVTFVAGQAGSFNVTTSGVPTVSSITESGTLPTGVTFTDNGNGTATINGTPTTGNTFPVTLTATNGIAPNATQNLSIQVNQAPAITTNPSNQTVQPGTSVTFTAAASGVPTPAVQWQRSTNGGASFANIVGATSASYPFTAALGDDGNQYRAVFTNGLGSGTTTAAALNVGTAPAFTSTNNATFSVGVAGSFALDTSGVPSATLSRTGAQFPAWLTLFDNGDGTGSLAGAPPAGSSGQYQFTLKAANGFSPSASQTFTLSVDASPTITSANHATFTVGSDGAFLVATTAGFPTTTGLTEIGPLPAGVSFVDNGDGTASLAGTPTAGDAGTYPFTVQATATGGVTAPTAQSFTLTVNGPPVITSADHATFTVGAAGSFTVNTTPGFPTARTLAETGTLPPGVTFTDNGDGTATLGGTPTSGASGVYALTLKSSNGIAPDPSQSFTLTVNEPPAITSADHATFQYGTAGTFTVTTAPGQPKTTTLAESGALPFGVTFTDNGDGTATLAGTPVSAGAFVLAITASNGVAPDATQAFTFTVSAPPVITSADHATFAVGSAGSFTVTTAAGTPTTTTLTESGALPSGVTFIDNGDGTATLAGTPTVGSGAAYSLMVTASNGVLPDSTQSFTLTVTALPAIASANLDAFSVGSAGTFTVTTTAGFPIATALTETGALPAGVTFVDNGDGTATLAGTPTAGAGGTYPLTLTATNTAGHVDQAYTLEINESTVISSAAITTFTAGSAGSFTVTTADGHPAPPTLTSTGTLPTGVNFVDNGDGTATLSGTPTAGGTFPLTITASNGASTDDVQQFVLTVNGPSSITSDSSADFTSGVSGSFIVTTTPGVPAATTLTIGGAVPAGLGFADNGDGTGTLSGTTTAAPGDYTLTITASNGVNPDAVQSLVVHVTAPLAVLLPLSVPVSTGSLQGVPLQPTVGETLHVSGGGFAAGAPVTIGVYSDPIVLAHTVAAADGTFTATIQVPNLFGHHTFVASGIRPDGTSGFLEAASTISPAVQSGGSSSVPGADSGGKLADTGDDLPPAPITGLSIGFILFGLVLVVMARRRRAPRAERSIAAENEDGGAVSD